MNRALVKWMNLIIMLPFVASADLARADDGFYVIAAGKRARRTILVSPQSTTVASGNALLQAVNGITDASENKPYLIIVEPGIYDLGGNSLQMESYVDIQGSGENVTTIKGNIASSSSGVLKGAENAELRFITVKNSGGGTYAIALYNDHSSPTINNVTAIAYGGATYNDGVYNYNSSSPTMINVTANASGGTLTHNAGIFNDSSSPTMNNVTATASASGGSKSYGVYNYNSSSPTMTNVTANASGGTENFGVRNNSSSPTMNNLVASASGGTNNYGVYNNNSSTVKINHSLISGTTNSVFTVGEPSPSTAYVGNTQLDGAVGGSGSTTCAGVYDASFTFHASTCP